MICKIGYFEDSSWRRLKSSRADLSSVFNPCTFYLMYRRTDSEDVSSPYMLTDFNITHTHPFGVSFFVDLD